MAKLFDIASFQADAAQLVQSRIDELPDELGIEGWLPARAKIQFEDVGVQYGASTLLWELEVRIALYGPVEDEEAITHSRPAWLFMRELCWLEALESEDGELRGVLHVKAMAELLAQRAAFEFRKRT